MQTIFSIIAIVVAFIGLGSIVYGSWKNRDEGIYVHLKTGNQYKIMHYGRQKNATTRLWSDCVIYYSLKDAHVYSRETPDFFENFQKLKDWKREQKRK